MSLALAAAIHEVPEPASEELSGRPEQLAAAALEQRLADLERRVAELSALLVARGRGGAPPKERQRLLAELLADVAAGRIDIEAVRRRPSLWIKHYHATPSTFRRALKEL